MDTKLKKLTDHENQSNPDNSAKEVGMTKNKVILFIIILTVLSLSTFGIVFTLNWSLNDPAQGIINYESSKQYQAVMSEYYEQVYYAFYGNQTNLLNQAKADPLAVGELKKVDGFYYCVETSSGYLFSNDSEIKLINDFYKKTHALIRIADTPEKSSLNHPDFTPSPPFNNQIYIGMDKPTFKKFQMQYEQTFLKINRTFYTLIITFLIIGFTGILLTVIVSLINDVSGKPPLSIYNKPYWDLYGLVVLITFGFTLGILDEINIHDFLVTPPLLSNTTWPALSLLALMLTAVLSLCCLWLSTFVKRVKRREFLSGSFMGTLANLSFKGIKFIIQALRSGPAGFYTLALLIAYNVATFIVIIFSGFIASMTFSLFISGIVFLILISVINFVALIFIFDKVSAIQGLSTGVDAILAGDLDVQIPLKGGYKLRHLAEQINQMATGLENAMEKELKAERMKTELITNVSHDLKTPLTAIISYIDLLKREGLSTPSAPEYLNILEEKAQKLKILTEDLFEAAKASSGNITISLEPLDIVALVHQGLGELSQAIETSALQIIPTLPDKEVLVLADGKYLWRVTENLFSNVLKHAMPGSRVYVSIDHSQGFITLTLKNISAHPLNVTSDQLLERFVRGEEARSTEGSGLGLSIAKDLALLQGGLLEISIDGDLFKAILSLKAVNI